MIESQSVEVYYVDQKKSMERVGVWTTIGKKKVVTFFASPDEHFDVGERLIMTLRRPEVGE